MASKTDIGTRANILAELWVNHRNDSVFVDLIEYNDLGLPLAYAIASELISTNPAIDALINETFDALLELREIEEDAGYYSLSELMEGVTDYDIPVLSTLQRVKLGHEPTTG